MQRNILLNLSDKCLTNKDVPTVLTALSSNPNINQLDLSNNLIGDQGIKEIVGSVLLHNIFYFNLYNNRIGDEGAVAVVRSSKLNNIASLNLGRNYISANGLTALAKHLPGSRIVNIDLIFNPGSDDHVAFKAILEATIKHPLLQYLHVPSEFNKVIRPALLKNRDYVSLTVKQLKDVIEVLSEQDKLTYPMSSLNYFTLSKFEEFYYNQMLNGVIIKLNCGVTCTKIQNYINDHYFKITKVVLNNLEFDDPKIKSIADLPPEILSQITRHCLIKDVREIDQI